MSQKTKIDWCDATWNPVTGCLHGCEYCYAAKMARRFGGKSTAGQDYLHVLENPANRENGTCNPCPYGFDPTFHRYRLDIPREWKRPRSIFVCSMADLFGEWVPDEWIFEILLACQRAPQHRYAFLTKNPIRYRELFDGYYKTFMLDRRKYHFGATATNKEQIDEAYYSDATWLSIEPINEPIPSCYLRSETWRGVVIGAETGNRKGKVIPKREWIVDIAETCEFMRIPVFMKESLRPIMGDYFRQDPLPWEVQP